jgi:hypothetical protein
MSESFSQPANTNEAPRTHEQIEQLKTDSLEKALDILSGFGLPGSVQSATPEEITAAVAELPSVIDELAAGGNDKRYIARPLSIYLEKAKRQHAVNSISEPFQVAA